MIAMVRRSAYPPLVIYGALAISVIASPAESEVPIFLISNDHQVANALYLRLETSFSSLRWAESVAEAREHGTGLAVVIEATRRQVPRRISGYNHTSRRLEVSVRVERFPGGTLDVLKTIERRGPDATTQVVDELEDELIPRLRPHVAESRALPAPPGLPPPGPPSGRRWALIVGIARFADPSVPSLGYPVRDARAFRTVLLEPEVGGFTEESVTVLTDEQATTPKIKEALDGFALNMGPEDLFVFFISSHAVSGQHDNAGDPYLITHDTRTSNVYGTAFPMRELVTVFTERIPARNIIGFLDACHTGEVGIFFPGEKGIVHEPSFSKTVKPALKQQTKRIVILTSSDGSQPSWELENLGHGAFTYYLVEKLRSSGGKATVGELFDHLREGVLQTVFASERRRQQPQLFSSLDLKLARTVGLAPTRKGELDAP